MAVDIGVMVEAKDDTLEISQRDGAWGYVLLFSVFRKSIVHESYIR